MNRPSAPLYSLPYIVEQICRDHQLDRSILTSRTRKRPIAYARQDGYWRALKFTGATLVEIAAAFGRKDHTTVIFGARAHLNRASKLVPPLSTLTTSRDGLSDDGVIPTVGA